MTDPVTLRASLLALPIGLLALASVACSGGGEDVVQGIEPGRGRIEVTGAVEGEISTGHSILHREEAGVYSLVLLAPPNHVVTVTIPDEAGEGAHEIVPYDVERFGSSGDLMATYSHDPPSSASTEFPTGTYGGGSGTLTITSWGDQIGGTYSFDATLRHAEPGDAPQVHVTGGFRDIDLPS